jgi:Family of unknown function (DUF6311)
MATPAPHDVSRDISTHDEVTWAGAVLIGIAAFLLVTGGSILRPTYVDWLMAGDPAQAWLGWQFFRHVPLWQWPFGANTDFGMDIGSSIVFTDSLPLIALLVKPFSFLLPDRFQYVGLWILTCFILQALFAWKLLGLFTKDRWQLLLGTAFFALAPAFLWRLHGHYSLFGQWVLLAGLYFYFSRQFSILCWVALLAVASLIHAYLFAMVASIWIADLGQRIWLQQMRPKHAVIAILAGAVCSVIVMWLAGYFMLGAEVKVAGFGFYRMNLLSLIDPDDWSLLLPNQDEGPGDYEGFNYLGIGVLGLALVAVVAFARSPALAIDKRRALPLLFLCVALTLYAISNRVAFGSHELFTYPVPDLARHFTWTFRTSGRMFWSVYYLIMLGVLILVFTKVERRLAVALCAILLTAQLLDSSAVIQKFREKFLHAPAWQSPMHSPLWADMAHQYRKIIQVLPDEKPKDWLPLSEFAATHRMAINDGYFARVRWSKLQRAQQNLARSIGANALDPNALYIFNDDQLWVIATANLGPADVAGTLDGFRVLAPGLRDCTTCDQAAIESLLASKR